jgi:hypothetical protein
MSSEDELDILDLAVITGNAVSVAFRQCSTRLTRAAARGYKSLQHARTHTRRIYSWRHSKTSAKSHFPFITSAFSFLLFQVYSGAM